MKQSGLGGSKEGKGSPPENKNFLPGLAQISSPPPQFGQLVPLFLDVKNDVLACITEPSNNDYDNDVSDNCDHNFGTFDDFGVKNDQKVSNNMILMGVIIVILIYFFLQSNFCCFWFKN